MSESAAIDTGIDMSRLIIAFSTENGAVCPNENDIPFPDVLDDHFRIEYLTKYADQVAMAIQRGVPVKSHLMWALTDNFECKSDCNPSNCILPSAWAR